MVGAAREDIDFDNDGFSGAQGDVNVGAVYIYKRTAGGPVFHQKIEGEGNNTLAFGDRFGAGIVLQGNIMFVGAANDNFFPGSVDPTPFPGVGDDFIFAGQVYVFNYDAKTDLWVLVQKLTSDEPNSNGSFGSRTNSSHMELFSFGNDPTIALIGEVENGSGLIPRLHVFKRNKKRDQWRRIQVIDAPSGGTLTGFADKVEGVGKFALVTESGIDRDTDPNVVYVYRIGPNGIEKKKGALQPIQTIVAPNGPSDCGGSFGSGLSAAKRIAVIGDPCDNTVGDNAGAVHVYTVNNSANNDPLTQVQTLTNPFAVPETFFGFNFGNGKQTITTDGNLILVGTANQSIPFPIITPQLDVAMFARDATGTFVPVDSIPSPAPGLPTLELYGQSVTLLGRGELAIGQMTDPDGVSFKGRVFLFDIVP